LETFRLLPLLLLLTRQLKRLQMMLLLQKLP
jgi:hypothetical protein